MELSGQSELVVFQCPAQIAQNVIYEVMIISFCLNFFASYVHANKSN